MNRGEFISTVDSKLKMIRNEFDYTQDKMAEIIGVSKKTLIQIEKQRGSLGWTGAVCVCLVFKDSEILQMAFGGDPQDIIRSLAFDNYEEGGQNTMGGKIWWRDQKGDKHYRVQQNLISQHYRILDGENRRICFSFDIEYINKRFKELSDLENINGRQEK
ncbi:MAG: helix-turn-helix domain-containing protein [Eubacteriales bacterium]|nr:helix-turn-helix domain-containing protein [Eubacteriales bacterium]